MILKRSICDINESLLIVLHVVIIILNLNLASFNSSLNSLFFQWNDVVRTLRSSMPVGRHRKNMRMYEDSFVASEAVDWLHQHLRMNPNFEPDVTRDQTIALLKKFQKMGIIQDARGPDHKNVNVSFEDNTRLFKITNIVLHSPAVRTQKSIDPSSRKFFFQYYHFQNYC